MTPQEEIQRAERARQILEDEVFREAFNQVNDALLGGMRNAGIVDEKLRLRLLDRYELLHSLVGCLRSTMESGKLARAQLDFEEKQQSFREKIREVVGFWL